MAIKYLRFVIAVGLIIIFVIIAFQTKKQTVTNNPPFSTNQPQPTNPPLPLKTIAWIPYWDQKNAFDSFSQNPTSFDYISLFWYRLDRNGDLTTYKDTVEDQSTIDFGHAKGVKILALIANLPDYEEGGDWDYKRVDKVINSAKTRTKHIDDILTLLQKHNFDGVDIDYEALKKSQKNDFSLFIEELAQKIHQQHKVVGVAIHPKTGEDKSEEANGSQAQDLSRLGQVADNLYYMLYTEHSISSDPGPAGSIDFAKKIIAYSKDTLKIPAQKIFFGIGLFGLEWKQKNAGKLIGSDDDLTFNQIQATIASTSTQPTWDNNQKSNYLTYQKNGRKYLVWFENSQSVQERIKLAQQLGLGGLAFWRLGNEDPQVWVEVQKVRP